MNQTYASLFTPWKIGTVEIKNRIVMCSMGGTSIFGWMEPNHFDKEAANFLLERARNNVGLILPGIAPIRDTMGGMWLYQNKAKFRQLKEFMDEFHKTGAKLFIQLTAGMGRSMAVNDLMVKMIKNKAFGLIGKPYSTWIISAPPPRPRRTVGQTMSIPARSPWMKSMKLWKPLQKPPFCAKRRAWTAWRCTQFTKAIRWISSQ